MATFFFICPLPSTSTSASCCPPSSFDYLSSSMTWKATHHFRRHLSIRSLHPQEPGSLLPALDKFWRWLQEEGVVSFKTPVKPAVVAEGLGLVAQRDIDENEVVLEVPRRLWINPDTVLDSEIGSVCCKVTPWVTVALFLIRERSREDSFWRHYFDILPERTNSTIFCTGQKKSFLKFKVLSY